MNTTIGNKIFVGFCVLIGLLSALFAFFTTEISDPSLAVFGYTVAAGLALASGWGVCSLVRNKLQPFTSMATVAFAGSLVFQMATSLDAIVHFQNPEFIIFFVTAILLAAGITFSTKHTD
jgi:hypothetical protein